MSTRLDTNVAQEIAAVRSAAGVWRRDTSSFIRFTRPDTASWLQSQTTNDVLKLESGQGHHNALLDRKGFLQAHFTLHRWEDEYWAVIEQIQTAHFLAQLDAHLFLEHVQMEDASADVDQLVVQGPRAAWVLARLVSGGLFTATQALPRHPHAVQPMELAGQQVLVLRGGPPMDDAYVLIAEDGQGAPLLEAILEAGKDLGVVQVNEEAQNILRIEAGYPRFGADMDSDNRLPETTIERYTVSWDKGCYLGQEVIAKLRTYSTVRKALMGLVLEDKTGAFPPLGTTLMLDGKDVGDIRSSCWSPALKGPVALAYLDRDHRAPGAIRTFDTQEHGSIKAKVVVLPFVETPSAEDRARQLYNEALERFDKDHEDTDETAIHLLEEAIVLAPAFEDAYETLGVILHRHGRVDEAIQYMKVLAELNPGCVMAHTNLSVFYVSKGMIQEAEEEKARAAVIQMRQTRAAKEAETMAAAERDRIKQEARERIGMFEEVLEIDPDDPLATYGMGAAYIQLEEFAKAVPYLERATQVQKDYSAAYLNLGKCHEFLGNAEAARATYLKGIEAANRKGDLMPLREMERRLKGLDSAI